MAVLSAIVALTTASVGAQNAMFRARMDVVRVDMLVTDHGTPVTGLKPSDIQILDNGIPQTIHLMSTDELPLSVVLAADMSGSMTGDRLEELRRAAGAMLQALKPDDKAALIGFSHTLTLESGLTTDRRAVLAALGRSVSGGGTSLYDACYAGLTIADSDAGRGLMVVLTDGVDTSSWLSATDVLDVAKRNAVVVYGVTIRPAAGVTAASGGRELEPARERAEALYGAPVPAAPPFLHDLSAETGGSVFQEDAKENLETIFAAIVKEFRQRYVVGYSPTGVPDTGWHRLEVRIKGRSDAVIKARPGYQAGG